MSDKLIIMSANADRLPLTASRFGCDTLSSSQYGKMQLLVFDYRFVANWHTSRTTGGGECDDDAL